MKIFYTKCREQQNELGYFWKFDFFATFLKGGNHQFLKLEREQLNRIKWATTKNVVSIKISTRPELTPAPRYGAVLFWEIDGYKWKKQLLEKLTDFFRWTSKVKKKQKNFLYFFYIDFMGAGKSQDLELEMRALWIEYSRIAARRRRIRLGEGGTGALCGDGVFLRRRPLCRNPNLAVTTAKIFWNSVDAKIFEKNVLKKDGCCSGKGFWYAKKVNMSVQLFCISVDFCGATVWQKTSEIE